MDEARKPYAVRMKEARAAASAKRKAEQAAWHRNALASKFSSGILAAFLPTNQCACPVPPPSRKREQTTLSLTPPEKRPSGASFAAEMVV
jgi:hypothetical protein